MLQSLFYLFMFTSSALAFQYSSALLPHFKYVSKYVMLIYRQWITVVDKSTFKIMQTKRANQFRSAQEQNIADFVRSSLVFGNRNSVPRKDFSVTITQKTCPVQARPAGWNWCILEFLNEASDWNKSEIKVIMAFIPCRGTWTQNCAIGVEWSLAVNVFRFWDYFILRALEHQFQLFSPSTFTSIKLDNQIGFRSTQSKIKQLISGKSDIFKTNFMSWTVSSTNCILYKSCRTSITALIRDG